MKPCTSAVRLNNGSPACGMGYCPYIYDESVDCQIKPEKGSKQLRRRVS